MPNKKYIFPTTNTSGSCASKKGSFFFLKETRINNKNKKVTINVDNGQYFPAQPHSEWHTGRPQMGLQLWLEYLGVHPKRLLLLLGAGVGQHPAIVECHLWRFIGRTALQGQAPLPKEDTGTCYSLESNGSNKFFGILPFGSCRQPLAKK